MAYQRQTNATRNSSIQNQGEGSPALRNRLPYCYTQDGGVIPVVYGTCKIEGTILYSGIGQAVSGKKGLIVWVGICCGKIKLVAVYQNGDVKLIPVGQGGNQYNDTQFNDGTGSSGPVVHDQAGTVSADFSKLPGIAHLLFDSTDGSNTCQVITTNNNQLPDLRYIVQRIGLLSLGSLSSDRVDVYPDQQEEPALGLDTFQTNMIVYKAGIIIISDGNIWEALPNINNSGQLAYVSTANVPPTNRDSDNYWIYKGTSWNTGSDYAVGDLVIGDDNNIYQCTVAHTPDFSTSPPNGLFAFKDASGNGGFWRLYDKKNDQYFNLSLYFTDSACFGIIFVNNTDTSYGYGLAFRSINPTGVPGLPGTYTGWKDDYCLANGPVWHPKFPDWQYGVSYQTGTIVLDTDGKLYYLVSTGTNYTTVHPKDFTPNTLWYKIADSQFQYQVGDKVIGTDGYLYVCISQHVPDASNRPITGTSDPYGLWNTFWEPAAATESAGNNPVAIALDIMTNPFYGLGMDSTKINFDVCNATADYYDTKGYGLNMCIKDIGEARSVLNKMIDLVDMIITVDTQAKICIRAINPDPTYTGNAPKIAFADDDYGSFQLNRQTWREITNEFEATYCEPGRLYEPTSIVVKNEAAIALCGTIKKKSIDLTAFTNKTIAIARLEEIMNRESFPRMSISCEVDRRAYALRPGDLITITKTEYGITNVVFLVTKVSLGKLDDMSVKLELIEPAVTQTYTP